MIDTEKINKVINELDQVTKEMRNAANLSVAMENSIKVFEDVISQSKIILTEIGKYDKKTDTLLANTNELTNKLQDIRSDYHKVSTAVELVEGDFKTIQKNLEAINLEIKNTATNIVNKINEVNESLEIRIDKATKDLKAENKELKAQLTDVQKEIGLIKKLAIGFGFGIGIIATMLIILLVR